MRASNALLSAVIVAAGQAVAAVRAVAADEPERANACLTSGAAEEVVGAHQVVAPGRAIVRAREAVPNADILRASLCREPDSLVYRIMVLRKDGRLVRVTVDAPSGKLKAVH